MLRFLQRGAVLALVTLCGLLPAIAQPFGPAAAPSLPTDYADGRLAGLVGGGVVNNGAMLATLCAKAVAAGQRFALVPTGSFAAADLAPDACANVILVGQGKLVGAYRKQVISQTAPPIPAPPRDVRSGQLVRWNAAVNAATAAAPAIACIWGDSTSTTIANALAASESLWGAIVEKIGDDYSGRPIAALNFGIGGATVKTMIGTTGVASYPAFWVDHTKSWAYYVQNATAGSTVGCDLLVIDTGMNDGATMASTDVATLMTTINGWSKVPSVIFVTTGIPSLQNLAPGYSDQASQEAREYAAGYIRSYARLKNYGLLDLNRRMIEARDGYDPLEQSLYVAYSEPGTTFTAGQWTASVATTDFSLTVGMPYSFQNGGTNALYVSLSPAAGNLLVMERDSSGNLAYAFYSDNGRASVARTVSNIAIPANDYMAFELDMKGGFATLSIRASLATIFVPVFQGFVERYGGLFQPSVAGGGTALIRNTITYSASTPKLNMPLMTDVEMYGVLNGLDGNGLNHGTSLKIMNVDKPVVAAAQFAP